MDKKIMNRKSFFLEFDKALHWFLPKDEANEVLAEYQEMQRQAASKGEELFQPNEKPWAVAGALKNPREYRKWLLVFFVLLLGPLLSFVYTFNINIRLFDLDSPPAILTTLLFWLSLPLAFFWAQHGKNQPGEPGRQPKLWAAAAALLLFNAAGSGFAIYCYIQGALENYIWLAGTFITDLISLFTFFNIIICLFSLLNCRLRSYRWLGLYIIGLLLLLGAMYYQEVICNFDVVDFPLNLGARQLHFYYLPLACGLAASLKILR